ncbi:CxC2-like cysteine cluster KDZ transposase-associated domain-containing protein [Pleurotus pulmonarius]
MQNLQGKVTLYDYYSALQKLTDNSGLRRLPSRYKEFVRMKREYAHLKSLKRAGRAHDPSGVSRTKHGELTVACPACPDPEVNLPRDWESAPPDRRFLYTLFIALDACFRLKRRMVSSVEKDPGLGIDWDQKEMSTCSGLAALDYANSKFSCGYAATGVCLGVCARHEFIQPNSAADLQVGERYANMDYTFASLMRHHSHNLSVVVSYDIACQWSKSLLQCVKTLLPLVRLDLVSTMVRFAVLKLHIHSHTKHFQHNYSLNYLPGVGRTDGEGIERPWANIGAKATSIRVMGPGAHIETLNDHWGHWNWKKTVGLGSLLSRCLQLAVSGCELQKASFEVFSEQQGTRVDGWKRMIMDFECDGSKTNPYAVAYAGLSEHNVWLQFSQEEAAEASRGVPSLHDVTRSGFIAEALDIEEQQLKTCAIVWQKTAGTAVQASEILELRTKLTRSLGRLCVMQAVYLPMVLTSLGQRAVLDGEEAEMLATEGCCDDTVHGEGGEDTAPLVAQEGYHTISWIWMDAAEVGLATGEGMDEVLRSEFAKSWARVRRWMEEVALLLEEMRCVTVSLWHRGQQWEKRATMMHHQSRPDYTNGLTAYAYSQADLLAEDADDVDKEDLQAEIDSATVEAEEDGEDGEDGGGAEWDGNGWALWDQYGRSEIKIRYKID